MKLSIIIVNYKTAGLVIDCLASLYRFSMDDTEVIVVDNDSEDNVEERLSNDYPSVRFIQVGYNAGFARANNVGINMSRGDAVLLLNADTIIHEDAVQECFQRLINSDYVAAGVQLLNQDGSTQISGNYAMQGGLNYLLPLPVSGKFFKWLASLLGVKKTNVAEATILTEVDWINGAFLMVKRSAIDKVGLLDVDFFLYFEEAEWCSRLHKAGKLCIYGDLHVTHLQGVAANEAFGSAGKGYYNLSDKKGFQIMLSCFLRLRKEFGVGWMLFMYFFYLVNIPVYGIAVLIKNIFNNAENDFSKNWSGFADNVIKIMSFLPQIISAKPYFYKVL
ncbi:MAG: glycosyltransferase family 2 protein [Ferruginibacter sp.]